MLFWLLLIATPLAAEVRVTVEGVRGTVLANVQAHLAIAALARRDGKDGRITAAEVRRRHQRARSDIETALQALGYYRQRIEDELVRVEDNWVATYRIDRGPRTRLRNVVIEIDGVALNNTATDGVLPQNLPAPGDRLHHGRYEASKRAVLESLYARGYLDAAFVDASLDVYPDDLAADVHWRIERGPAYEFGEIRLVQDVLHDHFARRFVAIEPGTPFDAAKLSDLQLNLVNSGYFSEVTVEIERESADAGRVPVTVRAEAGNSQFYRLGLGYGTDTGPRVTGGVEVRRLNPAGHRLRMDLRASLIRTDAAIEYAIPVRDVNRDSLKFYARAERAEIGDADSDQYTLGARIEDDWLGLRRAVYVQFSHELFQFGDAANRQSDLLTPGIQLSLQRGDDLQFTRQGFSATVDVHGGHSAILADTSFVHASAKATAVLPLTERSRLILRGALGVIEAEDFDALPPSQRFFTGGDRSVRGYAFESLSPKNEAGDDIGGAHYFNQSVEVDWLIWREFGLAAFFDRGGASDKVFGGQTESAGIGFRYRSPVGMVRLDVARPLDGSSGIRLHLTLGPDL